MGAQEGKEGMKERLFKDKEYEVYAPAVARIRALLADAAELQAKPPVVVGIDGRCGSGKTYFARLLAKCFSCNVVHVDDFYLPMDRRAADWETVSGGNIDFERLLSEVLLPLREGRRALYRPYHCREGKYGEAWELSPKPLVVAEGSYAGHPRLAAQYDLLLFFSCSGAEQAARLKVREGSGYEAFAEKWIPLEEAYFSRDATENKSSLIINTDGLF